MNGFYNFISYEYFRYEYSHIKDRLWRKTRSNHLKTRCVGVDPNRNWGHNWGKLILNKKLGGTYYFDKFESINYFEVYSDKTKLQ